MKEEEILREKMRKLKNKALKIVWYERQNSQINSKYIAVDKILDKARYPFNS